MLAVAVALDVLTTLLGLSQGLGEAGLLTSILYERLGLALGSITHYIVEYTAFACLAKLIVRLRPDIAPSNAMLLTVVYPLLAAGNNLGVLLRFSSV